MKFAYLQKQKRGCAAALLFICEVGYSAKLLMAVTSPARF